MLMHLRAPGVVVERHALYQTRYIEWSTQGLRTTESYKFSLQLSWDKFEQQFVSIRSRCFINARILFYSGRIEQSVV